MNNLTNDLDGPMLVRYWFDERLGDKKGYTTLALDEIDAGLKKLGVTEGGQLSVLTPQQIGREIGADALIYGELLDFKYQTTGFLNIRKVRARFKMVNSATGELLWEKEGLGANSQGATSSADALIAGLTSLGTQLFDKVTRHPLKGETWDMVWNAIEFLPRAK